MQFIKGNYYIVNGILMRFNSRSYCYKFYEVEAKRLHKYMYYDRFEARPATKLDFLLRGVK